MNMTRMRKVVALAGSAVVTLVGMIALAMPVSFADCPQPVACPAIAKICPQGQVACRVSPCNCTLACVPEGQCNN